jgi:hypothetical protein
MAKMTAVQAAAALIAAALAFKQKWEADLEEQEADRALMSEEQKTASLDSVQPEEMDEEDWWNAFYSFVGTRGLPFDSAKHPDILCIAGLNKDEPSFTLRGQDVFASILVKHWIELANGLSADVRARKIDGAQTIATAMEEYSPQKFPD